jgi:hypothetical protein
MTGNSWIRQKPMLKFYSAAVDHDWGQAYDSNRFRAVAKQTLLSETGIN